MNSGPPPSEAGPSKPSVEQDTVKREPHATPIPSYYSHLTNWTTPSPWVGNTLAYAPGTFPYSHFLAQPQSAAPVNQQGPEDQQTRTSRSPSPQPDKTHRHWDSVIRSFLGKMGLRQALKGFELDMVVLNSDWERENAPKHVEELVADLSRLKHFDSMDEPQSPTPLDARKLDYVPMDNPKPHSTTIKEISKFLARNRVRNSESNQAEFLQPTNGEGSARTNAKHQDRDLQMKYDIARNEDGPLRRTMQDQSGSQTQDGAALKQTSVGGSEAQRLPGHDERLRSIETHLAIRYVPSMPRDFSTRLKFLEDHIIRLERDYPPWAALHFNQPNRGWPPPPRSNPVIVPVHMREASSVSKSDAANPIPTVYARGEKSSLHQAVMERLQVQQALGELGTPLGT